MASVMMVHVVDLDGPKVEWCVAGDRIEIRMDNSGAMYLEPEDAEKLRDRLSELLLSGAPKDPASPA